MTQAKAVGLVNGKQPSPWSRVSGGCLSSLFPRSCTLFLSSSSFIFKKLSHLQSAEPHCRLLELASALCYPPPPKSAFPRTQGWFAPSWRREVVEDQQFAGGPDEMGLWPRWWRPPHPPPCFWNRLIQVLDQHFTYGLWIMDQRGGCHGSSQRECVFVCASDFVHVKVVCPCISDRAERF